MKQSWHNQDRRKIIEATLDSHPEFEAELAQIRHEMGLDKITVGDLKGAEAMLDAARVAHPHLAARMDALVDKLHALTYFTEADTSQRFGRYIDGYGFLAKAEAIKSLLDWAAKPLVLQKPESTRYHKFAEECDMKTKVAPYIFVVQHDWQAAMVNATEINTACEFRLPAKHCVFEFKISDRRAMMLMVANDDGMLNFHGMDDAFGLFVETPYGWAPAHPEDSDPQEVKLIFHRVMSLCAKQVSTICVCLEAEAIESEVIHAPYKMNRMREKRGRLPIFSYHVVNLTNRRRYARLPEGERDGEAGTKRRLHFVRGHWRHYPNHKTWIKWHLRGDPDLGFIDKEYRL